MLKTRFLTLLHKEYFREVMPDGQIVEWPWFVYVRLQIPLGRCWWRFSPAGTIRGVASRPKKGGDTQDGSC